MRRLCAFVAALTLSTCNPTPEEGYYVGTLTIKGKEVPAAYRIWEYSRNKKCELLIGDHFPRFENGKILKVVGLTIEDDYCTNRADTVIFYKNEGDHEGKETHYGRKKLIFAERTKFYDGLLREAREKIAIPENNPKLQKKKKEADSWLKEDKKKNKSTK